MKPTDDADEGRILKERDGAVNLTGRRSLLDAERQVHKTIKTTKRNSRRKWKRQSKKRRGKKK